MLRAVVFDFDGVLANSEPLHYQAYRDVLAREAIALSEADYYAQYLGYDDFGAFRTIARDRGREWSEAHIAGLIATKARQMEILERTHSVLFPGAAAVVRRFAAALPIAVASGALRAEILRVLDREQLTACFSAIVAAEDTPASKPAPDPYLRAVALLAARIGGDLTAREVVAIEDSFWGLESARRAGLHTVGVAQTYPATALEAADLVIASVGDISLESLQKLCRE
jgi:HAD superfamily hydrolase (TIGR01509 family)